MKRWIASLEEEALKMIKADGGMAREVLAKYTACQARSWRRFLIRILGRNEGPTHGWKMVLVLAGRPVGSVDVKTIVVS